MSDLQLRRLNAGDADFGETLDALLAWDSVSDEAVASTVAAVLADIRQRGDAAVLEYTRRFDAVEASNVSELEFSAEQLQAALARIDSAQRQALEEAADRIRRYHERQQQASWQYQEDDGTVLGQQIRGMDRGGLYVPGGKATYPSSVLMNAVPAKVAGVGELIAVSPTPNGYVNDMVLAAAAIAGVDRLFAVGGAQAIAALAFGTETIPRVDKIVGPGNIYVATAKRQVFGKVGIDMIAGPSEILVIADDQNDPAWIAADLLSQAEHDPSSQSILITDSADFAAQVEDQVDVQAAMLATGKTARAAWDAHGAIIVVPTLDDAMPLANRIAAEHVELAVDDPEALFAKLRHAGSVFLGRMVPEAVGDYVAGPNHVLPTGRRARFASGLSVLDFMKRTSFIDASEAALAAIGPAAVRLAEAGGLPAHALSISTRLK